MVFSVYGMAFLSIVDYFCTSIFYSLCFCNTYSKKDESEKLLFYNKYFDIFIQHLFKYYFLNF